MSDLLVDIHEPTGEFTSNMTGVIPFHITDLNNRGYADYMWSDIHGNLIQIERKQWGELLGGLDSVENQLRNHLQRQPECRTGLLVEGMAVGSATGTRVLKGTNKNHIYVGGYEYSIRLSQLYAWLYQLSHFIPIYGTSGYYETCVALSAFYKGDQKENHTTFQRAFKKVEFHVDPRVTQVMGIFPGIGEKRASALIKQFTTIYNIINASPKELTTVEGIGPKLSVDLLRRAGRLDV